MPSFWRPPAPSQATDLMRQHPDLALILLDLKLPDRDGIEVLRELRERYPAISIVMLSAFNDRDNVVKALDNGALGFIPKTDSRDVLLGALRLILAGGTYIPPEALRGSRWQPPPQASRRREAPIAGRARADGKAGRGAGADDAGQEQQADLPRARPGRADGEEPCVGDSQGTGGHQPHRGGAGGGRAGLGAATADPLIAPTGSTLPPCGISLQQAGHDGAQGHGIDGLVQEMMAAAPGSRADAAVTCRR